MHQDSIRARPWAELQLLPKELICDPPLPITSLWVGPMDSTQDYGCCGICLCVQVVKELLSQGADPNLPLTKGLGTALCVVCDLVYEQQRSIDNKIALVRGRVGGCWGKRWGMESTYRVQGGVGCGILRSRLTKVG